MQLSIKAVGLWLTTVCLCLSASAVAQFEKRNATCRCFPGEHCWPSDDEWSTLNNTVSGRLIKIVPLGAPCHDPTYNETECAALQATINSPDTFDDIPAGIMAPLFTNNSCDVFTSEESPCQLGNYARYAIEVETPEDAAEGIKFAVSKNIRLTIKNTGHDYMGKSTGAGSLALWTHKLQNITFLDYASSYYTGKAGKVGAGLQGYDLDVAGKAEGVVFLAGACATVGTAGGYTQGGGHSPLSNLYGLSADQVLEWEVVDGKGNLLTATPTNNSDLYWALSGGGGGTYGVVVSVTLKAHPDTAIAGGSLNFTDTTENYWTAIELYHSYLSTIVDSGVFAIESVGNGTFVDFIHGPNKSADDVTALFQPYLDNLTALGIEYKYKMVDFPDYSSEYTGTRDVFHFGVGQGQAGGYLIPRSIVEVNNSLLTNVSRQIAEGGLQFKGFAVNVSKVVAGNVDNAVHPSWRNALIHCQVTLGWNTTTPFSGMVAQADALTNIWMPILRQVSPDGAAYMNEADSQQPDWQSSFYGPNYDKLRSIKKIYDPADIFYANKAVGSDEWVALPLPDGRLCRA